MASADKPAGLDRGKVYIFDRDNGGTDNWGEIKNTTASDVADRDYFGESVSISGSFKEKNVKVTIPG